MTKEKTPFIINETAGTKYYCKCGKSKNLPYCDGAHQGTEVLPFKVEIDVAKTVAICSCGQSKNLPFCDGTHKR